MKFFIFLLCIVCWVIAGNSNLKQELAVYSGLSLVVGEDKGIVKPGLNLNFDGLVKIKKVYAFGGNISYSWFSMNLSDNLPEDHRASLNYWDIGCKQKLFIPVSDKFNMFFSATPSLYLRYRKKHEGILTYHKTGVDFGITGGAGFHINYFIFVFNYKRLLINSQINWLTFSVGYRGRS